MKTRFVIDFTIEDLKKLSSEQIVRVKLEERGYVVDTKDSENSNGFDVVAIKGGSSFIIEVKKACESTRSYRVTKISEAAKYCTHIAIVTPMLNVVFQPMKDHLKLCSPDGTRGITNLVDIYDA